MVERTFRTYGLPKAMRSDNGPPFAANSAGGLTRLSLGWVKVGIELERIAPGKPRQNGRHERFHRTLKAETSRPPAGSPREQQAHQTNLRFARFTAARPGRREAKPNKNTVTHVTGP